MDANVRQLQSIAVDDRIFIIRDVGQTLISRSIAVDDRIFIIRGMQVMIDSDLAELYGVETKRINEAVRNNPDKFPSDFCFELGNDEFEILRSKFSTAKFSKTRSIPKVFTEQGVYMLATVLKSKTATDVTISIMRTFTKIKNLSVPYFDIIKRLEKLEINDKETRKLLQKVIQAVSIMQDIQDEASQNTKKIGFKID
jgi:hypothetical protein